MQFVDHARGASIRTPLPGVPGALDRRGALRLGRALGTVLARRNRSDERASVAVATADDDRLRPLRDGVVAGLVLSGCHVVDLAHADSELFAFALRAGCDGRECAAGVLVSSTGDALSVMVFEGLTPLVGDALVDLARVADAGRFVVGVGTIASPELRAAFRAEPDDLDIDVDRTYDDTHEGPAL